MHDKFAHDDPQSRQRANHFDRSWVYANFFMRFSQSGLLRRLARINAAARQTDLSGMMRKVGPPFGEDE
jgi:hypothetical protein